MSAARWRSLHPAIADLDASGLIRTIFRGEATIEVEAAGVTARVVIPVRGILHATYGIDKNETWRVADTPHVVQHYLRVGGTGGGTDTTTLTIEPGSTVRFRPGAGLYVGDIDPGSLVIPAGGAPAVMEGDSAARGSWVGVWFAGPGRSELRNLTLRHCGAPTPGGAAIACLAASDRPSALGPELLIGGLTVTQAIDGLDIGHWVTFATGSRDLSIENTSGHMATISPQVAGTFPRGGHFTGNVENEIRITNGPVERSATWEDVGAPWRLVGGVTFSGSARPRPGVPPSCSNRPAVAGAASCSATAAPSGARSVGMSFGIGAKFSPASRNLTITEAGDVPIETRVEAIPSLPSGDFRFNATDAIRVRWAAISQHASWPNPAVPYLLSEGLSIGSILSPDSASLTLAPGVVMQMAIGTEVAVGNGALRALGTPTEAIVFTSVTPGVAGSWVGIALGSETQAQLEYVEIRDAGAGPEGYSGALRMSADPGGVLRNSIIRRSASCGVILFDLFGSPHWTDNYADPAFGNAFVDVAGPTVCPSFP